MDAVNGYEIDRDLSGAIPHEGGTLEYAYGAGVHVPATDEDALVLESLRGGGLAKVVDAPKRTKKSTGITAHHLPQPVDADAAPEPYEPVEPDADQQDAGPDGSGDDTPTTED